jgi:predicted DNA-binding protein (MmcQ/YjbR family)
MTLKQIAARLRAAALVYPGAVEEFPWGERVVKAGKKVFVFLGRDDGAELSLSVKLPGSGAMALSLPFTSPTGYGLGKSGWISATFTRAREVPVGMLLEWLEESYRAVAPRRLVAQLDAAPAPRPARSRGRGGV